MKTQRVFFQQDKPKVLLAKIPETLLLAPWGRHRSRLRCQVTTGLSDTDSGDDTAPALNGKFMPTMCNSYVNHICPAPEDVF